MDIKEKILLVQLLLIDIRCNWGWEKDKGICSRAKKARDLCNDIANRLNDDRYLTLASRCDEYIRDCSNGYGDGRYFRDTFPYGYEDMDNLHGLKTTFSDKSEEFKTIAKSYITYPDTRFDDWEG